MANEQHFESVIVEDHFGSGLGGELDWSSQVVAALDGLARNPAKLEKLGRMLSIELSRRARKREALQHYGEFE